MQDTNIGLALTRLQKNYYEAKFSELKKKTSIHRVTKSAALIEIKAVLKELKSVVDDTLFDDVRRIDRLSALDRSNFILQHTTMSSTGFHGYPSKLVAYADLTFSITHLEWLQWRLNAMREI